MKFEINDECVKLNDEVILYYEDDKKEKSEKNTNHTLEELRQKLINDMYEKECYEIEDIAILQILFETKKD